MGIQPETTVDDSEKKRKRKKRKKAEDEARHPEAELEPNAMVVDSVDSAGMSSAILKIVQELNLLVEPEVVNSEKAKKKKKKYSKEKESTPVDVQSKYIFIDLVWDDSRLTQT
jgi:hypothetical protein